MTNGRKHSNVLALAVAVAVFFTLGASSAWADTEVYDLTSANFTPACPTCTGPYVQVTIDLTTPTTATVTFDSLTNGGYIYLLGSGNVVAVDANGTATISNISGTIAFSPLDKQSLSDGGSTEMDGFGNFSNSISAFDGFTNTYTEISFTLTNTTGTWSSAANVIAGTDGLAAHPFACVDTAGNPCTSSSGATITGFVGAASPVPEPKLISVLSALGGLMAIVVWSRRRTLVSQG